MNRERTDTIISSFWVIAGLVAVIAVGYYFRNIWMLVLLSFIFASALHPGVQLGRRFRIPAPISLVTMYVLIFLVLSLLLSFVIPPLAQQTSQLAAVGTQMLGLEKINVDPSWALDLNNLKELANSYQEYSNILTQFTGSLQTAFVFITSTFSVMFVFVTWLVMTSHISLSVDHFAASFAWLLPEKTAEKKAERARNILQSIMRKLGGWVRGQLVLMFAIGIVSYLGLTLLGVPYALPLAIIAGLLEIVPNLGPTLSSIPAIVIAFFFVNPLTAVVTAVFYFLMQLLENSFLVPQVMKEAVDVHPLTTLILMLLGFQAMGVVGAVGILPLYIIVRTLVQELVPGGGPFANLEQYIHKK
ncbi:AI-2E family transporter [Candidatus Woesebacteria bacterium]|nr:AI-2E family transporter [Candidatus Woesebacteria bacterium]MCD8506701.1 AI-2E family transporter [Candidatus Woesebacteria bacterium]MCD8527607.1 AI-2E family transporter [Candidatus Woesebacteria bacterium]MCD8546422.1 AI-2E family transporter [Candidatus Woesebacteria bacterium]